MATTTNYSWTTPNDTDLVKDGAAAIRSLGTAIDSTVFTNAGAAINKTIIDAKGDLIVGTAADTAARLAVGGTNGHVLQVDSSTASGLKWASADAGGMILINTGGTVLSGTSTTIGSIPGTYRNLQLVVVNYTGSSNDVLDLRVNADTTTNYRQAGSGQTTAASGETKFYLTSGSDASDTKSLVIVNFFDYTNASTYHVCEIIATNEADAGTNSQLRWQVGIHNNIAAITSLVLFNENGGSFTGTTTAYLYGVK
jgi:hypothetical protein